MEIIILIIMLLLLSTCVTIFFYLKRIKELVSAIDSGQELTNEYLALLVKSRIDRENYGNEEQKEGRL